MRLWEDLFRFTRNERIQMIAGYQTIIEDKIKSDWQPYLVNFMFSHMPGDRNAKLQIMEAEVERVYTALVTHVVRKPNSPSHRHKLPVFLGCPDLPVAKQKRLSIEAVTVNDGWHFNGCLLLPPFDWCRLKCHLQDHFNRHCRDRYYVREHPLLRIDAKAMYSAGVADYIFKQFKRGNVTDDHILVLPRTRSEISSRSSYENNSVR